MNVIFVESKLQKTKSEPAIVKHLKSSKETTHLIQILYIYFVYNEVMILSFSFKFYMYIFQENMDPYFHFTGCFIQLFRLSHFVTISQRLLHMFKSHQSISVYLSVDTIFSRHFIRECFSCLYTLWKEFRVFWNLYSDEAWIMM